MSCSTYFSLNLDDMPVSVSFPISLSTKGALGCLRCMKKVLKVPLNMSLARRYLWTRLENMETRTRLEASPVSSFSFTLGGTPLNS